MNYRRKLLVALGAGALVAPLGSFAQQQPKKVPRIGFISSSGSPENPWPSFVAFQEGMRDLGYIEGQNLLIEHRYGEGRLDRMPGLVNELVQQKVDVLIGTNNVVIRAAKKATKTIPIVMVSSIDPVAAGYVESLARPGGNITGLAFLGRDLSAKRVELLKEMLPRMSRVAIIWNPEGPGPTVAFKEYQSAAAAFKLTLQSLEVKVSNPAIEAAFRAAKKERAEALIIVENPLIGQHLTQILQLTTKSRLPSMTENNFYVAAGGLMSYGANRPELYRRAATYVDKILKGAKPTNLPVEQPTKFELVVNLKTAKAIGITIPQSVLFRADRVIE
jgi:putative ABC transport system substrate-binding protein